MNWYIPNFVKQQTPDPVAIKSEPESPANIDGTVADEEGATGVVKTETEAEVPVKSEPADASTNAAADVELPSAEDELRLEEEEEEEEDAENEDRSWRR